MTTGPSSKSRGYTPLTIVNELRQIAHLSRFLEERRLTGADLSTERLRQFLDLRRERHDHRACSLQGLIPLLEILDEQGVERLGATKAPASPTDTLLGSFESFLLSERGLVPSTAASYVLRARRFLDWRAPSGELAHLRTRDVTDAVQREAATVSVGAAQLFVVSRCARFCGSASSRA